MGLPPSGLWCSTGWTATLVTQSCHLEYVVVQVLTCNASAVGDSMLDVDFTDIGGVSVCTLRIKRNETVADLRTSLAHHLESIGFRLLLPNGNILGNHDD